MAGEIDYDDAKYPILAADVLGRHNHGDAEANITSAIRDFLVQSGLVDANEIIEEEPPSGTSRCFVDLTALDTFIEVKRRVGNGLNARAEYVDQLDSYLAESQQEGQGVRMGILTDGKYWLLRWPGAGPARAVEPYAFTLEDPDGWLPLYEWLRDTALVSLDNLMPDKDSIKEYFGPNSAQYERDFRALKTLYNSHAHRETIRVKRELWEDLLKAALGELARDTLEMDDLFVRHTYLSAVIRMVVQARFGIDIQAMAERDPADLLAGEDFRSKTGLQGVMESDFFTWPNEVGGGALLKTLARRVARFDWQKAPIDIAAILYESVIPPDERRQLGEYYTPPWLARAMVRELVTDPTDQSVLDPACGSGTFVAEAVLHFIEAAKDSLDAKDTLEWLRFSIAGIDIHPVAVHLARAAWVLAAQPAIEAAAKAGSVSNITVPIYLGDALQLHRREGDIFEQDYDTIRMMDGQQTEMRFPLSLVDRAETFDAVMYDISRHIEEGRDPIQALNAHGITDAAEREALEETIAALQQQHSQGRDHIWAYYTRNVVRPVAWGRKKVDVIIGNPPWLNYNRTVGILREGLEGQSKQLYGIWQGGRYATHQDVAGLFFTRCVDLYLKPEPRGVIGMVMPHSTLQTGQYAKWRTGNWKVFRDNAVLAVDFSFKKAWDLERLEPNSFFPIPASVVFARRGGVVTPARALEGQVERWEGKTGTDGVRRVGGGITDTSRTGQSPYAEYSRNGATIFPRCFFFVEEIENPAIIQAGQTVTVTPFRSKQEKAPWNRLDVTSLTGQTIEARYLFDVHLGETVVPYGTLEPRKALLPIDRQNGMLPAYSEAVGSHSGGLEWWMSERWRTVCELWEDNKSPANKLSMARQLDYYGKLSAQLEWWKDSAERPVRIAYSSSGNPTAAILENDDCVVENVLFWLTCKCTQEAFYLVAIINSDVLQKAVAPLMPKGQFGARHLHKHLWKLPIPEFDASNGLHDDIARAGETAAAGAAVRLEELRKERGAGLTVTIARREIRKWLRESVVPQFELSGFPLVGTTRPGLRSQRIDTLHNPIQPIGIVG